MEDVLKALKAVLLPKTSSESIEGDATVKTGSVLSKAFGVLRGLCWSSGLGVFFGD